MDRRVTPPKRVTSPTWGPPPPSEQALRKTHAVRACLHGVGDPGLVGLFSFVFTLWGTQNKRNLPYQTGVPHSI